MVDKTTGQAIRMLLTSRKFLVAVLDFIVSAVLFFGAKYAAPSAFEDIKFLIGGLQILASVVIVAIAVDNRTEAQAQIAKMQSTNPITKP